MMEGADFRQTHQLSRQSFSIAALLGPSRQQPSRPKPERAQRQLCSQQSSNTLGSICGPINAGSSMCLPCGFWDSLPRGVAHQGRCTSNNTGQQENTRERRKTKETSKKRTRTAFTNHQIKVLESEFKSNRYLTISRRNELAKSLELSDNQIKIWFQNRRTKLKRQFAADIAFSISRPGHLIPSHPTMHSESYCPQCVFKMPSCWNYAAGTPGCDGQFGQGVSFPLPEPPLQVPPMF